MASKEPELPKDRLTRQERRSFYQLWAKRQYVRLSEAEEELYQSLIKRREEVRKFRWRTLLDDK